MTEADVRPEAALDETFGRLPVDPRGEAMLRELLTIHDLLRENVQIVGALAEAVAAGLPTVEVQGQVLALSGEHGLRLLQVNCFAYCRFVHGHHGLEDAAVFPRVRAAHPAIGPVVDQLVADHRRVADLLDDAEAAAAALSDNDRARGNVVRALDALSQHLLEHLAYEERSLGPTLQRMTGWYELAPHPRAIMSSATCQIHATLCGRERTRVRRVRPTRPPAVARL